MAVTPLNPLSISYDREIEKVNQAVNRNNRVQFSEKLMNALDKVNEDQLHAEEMDRKLALGEIDNLHDVTIAAMKADLSLSLAVEVTNKLLSAYNEIMRLQL